METLDSQCSIQNQKSSELAKDETSAVLQRSSNTTTRMSFLSSFRGLIELSLYKPYFTFVLLLSIWLGYFVAFGLTSIDKLFFYTVTPYSNGCLDARIEIWRLWSNQFCHASIEHIVLNSLILIPLSALAELLSGPLFTFICFETGVVTGNLGFTMFEPFVGLLGASHGVSGLVGGSMATLMLNADCFRDKRLLTLFVVIYLSIVLLNVVDYYTNYQSSTAYTAHLYGFLGGLAMGFTIVGTVKPRRWKCAVRCIAAMCVLLLFGMLLYHYIDVFPPVDNQASNYCCIQILHTGIDPCVV